MCGRVLIVAGIAAVLAAAPAVAAEPGSAWARAGAPFPAKGFFDPAVSPSSDAARALESYALFDNGGGILDEVRLGVLAFWQTNADSEEGVYVTGQVLFDPFVAPFDNWILDILLRPRPHIGGNASLSGTDQLFGGLTWSVPIGRIFFAEASFGGTIHNGPLENAQVALGCRVLFRESIAVGANLGEHWRVVAGIDHSSHAELCGNDNDGLTHVGGSLGYRF